MSWTWNSYYLDHKLHTLLLELTCSVLTHMKVVKSFTLMHMGFQVFSDETWDCGLLGHDTMYRSSQCLTGPCCLHPDFYMMIEAAHSAKMLVTTSKNKQCHNPECHTKRCPQPISSAIYAAKPCHNFHLWFCQNKGQCNQRSNDKPMS
jgi:hypothetical protein